MCSEQSFPVNMNCSLISLEWEELLNERKAGFRWISLGQCINPP